MPVLEIFSLCFAVLFIQAEAYRSPGSQNGDPSDDLPTLTDQISGYATVPHEAPDNRYRTEVTGGPRETWIVTGRPALKTDSSLQKELKTYCWAGLPKSIWRLWYTAYFALNITDDQFHLYEGSSATDVYKQYRSSSRWFALLPWRDRTIRLNGFSPTCLGVFTNKPYQLGLNVHLLDPWRFAMFIAGVLLLLFGRKMSRNTVFHYSSAIGVSLLGSLLVVVYIVSRMIPRKTVAGTFLIGGWAVVLYFFQTLWTNFREMLLQHRNYVAGYFGAVSLVTFVLIYRFGGVREPRTMDILQWGLQMLGATMIYLSCTLEVVGVLLVLGIGLVEVMLHKGSSLRRIWLINRIFPPRPPKLLSQAEFDELGRRETIKQLAALRNYVNSPESSPWKLVTKLSQPERFGSFADGQDHLTPAEVDTYEREVSWDGIDDEQPPAPRSAPQRSNGFRNFASRLAGGRRNGSNTTPASAQWTDDEDADAALEAMDYD